MLTGRFVNLAIFVVISSVIQTLIDKKTGFQPSDSIVARLVTMVVSNSSVRLCCIF